ncbi:MAG: ATP-binding protein [Lachnospiraceae bacterium]|nr:ATP-binding protein [Lachnospiraceae bacterium]
MKELKLTASDDTLYTVLENIRKLVADTKCSEDDLTSILVSAEEIYVNIAHYAYGGNPGEAVVQMWLTPDKKRCCLTFKDRGMKYNPLEKADPDTTLSGEQRKIGGLGVYMVKNMMDSVSYEYKDGQNIFSMEKDIE